MGREQYQVRVHIIEARQLKGTDKSAGYSCNPVTRVCPAFARFRISCWSLYLACGVGKR